MTMSSKVRRQLYEWFGGRCYYCGKPLLPDTGPHHDGRDWLVVPELNMITEHMWPKSRGGTDVVDNLASSCAPCNTLKGSFMPEEFRLLLAMRSGKWPYYFLSEKPCELWPERDGIMVVSKTYHRSMLAHNFPYGYWSHEHSETTDTAEDIK